MLKKLCSIGAVFALASALQAQSTAPTSFSFDFGSAPAAAGHVQVTPAMDYSKDRHFGFEPGTKVEAQAHAITGDAPFFFHVAVPEGNYKVTVTFGDSQKATDDTVYAELRRLMIEHVHTDPGKSETRTFIVNVRTPAILGGGQVKINGRERTMEPWAWDDRLSLEFNGAHPGIESLKIESIDVPTVYLLGDSTVCDQPKEPYNSWGQMLTRFFKPEVAVCNGAESGDSIAPALAAGRFDKFWKQMKAGDYLFIQFGHNDMKNKAPNALEIYTDNMRKAVDETRAHGGTPVLVTSVSRRSFDDNGKITNSFGGYTDAVRQVAKEKGCALIDLQNMGAAFYEAMGPDKSHQAFAKPEENTHHNDYGSYEIAKCVVRDIKQNHLDLAKFIVDDFKDFDPSHPDPVEQFNIPKSPQVTNIAPLGS